MTTATSLIHDGDYDLHWGRLLDRPHDWDLVDGVVVLNPHPDVLAMIAGCEPTLRHYPPEHVGPGILIECFSWSAGRLRMQEYNAPADRIRAMNAGQAFVKAFAKALSAEFTPKKSRTGFRRVSK